MSTPLEPHGICGSPGSVTSPTSNSIHQHAGAHQVSIAARDSLQCQPPDQFQLTPIPARSPGPTADGTNPAVQDEHRHRLWPALVPPLAPVMRQCHPPTSTRIPQGQCCSTCAPVWSASCIANRLSVTAISCHAS